MSYPNEIGTGKNKSKSTDGSLGKWNGDSFEFHSSGAETEWLRQAYRQAVSPMTWQSARPADSKTDVMLKAMPEKAGTAHFKGPDGQFRVIGPEQREPQDVTEHRRQSVTPWLNTLPKQQRTTWQDLADLPEDHPHPGEAEQVAKWMGTYDSLKGKVPTVIVAEGPLPRPFRVVNDVTPEEIMVGKPLADGGGRRGVVAGAGGLPPAPKQPTTQGEALANVAAAANDDILSAIPTLTDKLMKEPPVLNFNSMKTRPYPPTAAILDTTQPAPALGLNAEQMQNMSWVELDQKLRAQDTYNPLFDSPPIRLQSLRSHARSPLAAAQEALDIVHETHLAKGRDWNQVLPLHPEIAKTEFDNALEATVTEATTLWTGRKDSRPTALEIEQIRQYVAPRLVGYFPASMRDNLLKRDTPSSTLPEIKNGAQRIGDLMTALTFGEIKEITVDGQKIELSEIGIQPETATETKKRAGSHGAFFVKRFNYLVGQEVQQMLRDCPEAIDSAEVVNGPKTPTADGQSFEPFTENTVQDPRRKGVKDSMRSDIAIRLVYNGQDCIFHINSVDMSDPYNADRREQRNFNRGVENARALFEQYSNYQKKLEKRISNMTLSQLNALAMIPKPTTDDEIEFQKILKDFMKRLDCASIIAECEKGAGYLDTLPKRGMTEQ
jgi:hypothetical protein